MSNHPASNTSSLPSASAPNDGDSHDSTAQGPAPGLHAPSLTNDNVRDNSISAIVARLMNPPEYLRNNEDQTVTLTITWAVGAVGLERFQLPRTEDRLVLQGQDELGEQGEEAGSSAEIMAWLKDGEDTLTLPASHFE